MHRQPCWIKVTAHPTKCCMERKIGMVALQATDDITFVPIFRKLAKITIRKKHYVWNTALVLEDLINHFVKNFFSCGKLYDTSVHQKAAANPSRYFSVPRCLFFVLIYPLSSLSVSQALLLAHPWRIEGRIFQIPSHLLSSCHFSSFIAKISANGNSVALSCKVKLNFILRDFHFSQILKLHWSHLGACETDQVMKISIIPCKQYANMLYRKSW